MSFTEAFGAKFSIAEALANKTESKRQGYTGGESDKDAGIGARRKQ